MIKKAIEKIVGGEGLSFEEAAEIMSLIMEGKATHAQIGSLLTGLRIKGETPEEIAGFALVMIKKAAPINPVHTVLVDTCGTGGDGKGTFNISTAAAFVVAGAGLAVAKHGNRSVSSKSGSADVLEAMGVKIDLHPQQVEYILNNIGIAFLYAPVFHKAMKHAVAPRKEIGIRSIFNVLGPLTNPAGANYQVVGVYDPDLTETIARVLDRLGVTKAFVVHGAGGLDEISPVGPTKITQLKKGSISTFYISPEEFGLKGRKLEEILGKGPKTNAEIIKRVLQGEEGPYRDTVILNAAAALAASDAAESFQEGLEIARESIDSGRAWEKLEQLIKLSNSEFKKVRLIS